MKHPLEAPHSWDSPCKGLLITASILSCWIQLTLVQGVPVTIVPIPPYGTVGGNITLTIQGFSEKAFSYIWFRKSTEESNMFVRYFLLNGMQIPADSREMVFPNGSLLIPKLSLNDTDLYIVLIVDSLRVLSKGQGKLRVYEKLNKPNITINITNIRENDSLVLPCSTENEEVNIRWFSNNQPLSLNDRMILSTNNQTLTILSVKREDAGLYQCEAWNPISANRSDPLTLTVIYGPDLIKILFSPESGEIEVQFNDSLTLECEAQSYPPTTYEWHVNDTSGSIYSGSTYAITHTSWEHSGKYVCWARNNMTNITICKDITIKVVTPKSSERGIAGIVIGVLVGVSFIGTLIYFLFILKTGRTSKHHVPEKTHSVHKYGEDITLYENVVCLKDPALLGQGLDSFLTSPEVPFECPYETLNITRVDCYDKILSWKNPRAQERGENPLEYYEIPSAFPPQ